MDTTICTTCRTPTTWTVPAGTAPRGVPVTCAACAARTTSDLAGLAAREAGYVAPTVDRVAEIRGRLEAAVMGPGLDKFGSAIVDNFGCCVVCGKWTNPGHPDAQSHKDGCTAHREEVRYAQALHAIYRTVMSDLRHLLDELAETTARLDVIRQSHAACVTQRDAALTALAEAEAEINRGRPGYSWIADEALASLTEIQQRAERDRHALAVERGREGPEGWVYNFGQGRWVGGTNVETAYVERMPWVRVEGSHQIAWAWNVWRGDEHTEGIADTALGAIEAAGRVMKGP